MKLSPSQTECYEWILINGCLVRYPGGFWASQDAKMKKIYGGSEAPEYSFGTTTLQSLENKGLVKPTEWKKNRNGEFPVKYEPIL